MFYHNLLITKLHYIDCKNYADGMHGSKYRLHGYQKVKWSQWKVRMKQQQAPCQKVPSVSPALKFCWWNVMVSQKTTNWSMIMVQLLSSYGKHIFLIWEKNGKDQFTPRISMLKICDSCLNVASTDLDLNHKSGKNHRNVPNTYNLSDHQFEEVWRGFGA